MTKNKALGNCSWEGGMSNSSFIGGSWRKAIDPGSPLEQLKHRQVTIFVLLPNKQTDRQMKQKDYSP